MRRGVVAQILIRRGQLVGYVRTELGHSKDGRDFAQIM